MSLSAVASPSAAMASRRPALDSSTRAVFTGPGTSPRLFTRASTRNAIGEARHRQRRAVALASAPGEEPGDRQHHRSQQQHAKQLHDDGIVADRVRHRIAGAGDLRDVMDGRAEHDAGRLGVEPDERAQRRIGDHRDRRQGVHRRRRRTPCRRACSHMPAGRSTWRARPTRRTPRWRSRPARRTVRPGRSRGSRQIPRTAVSAIATMTSAAVAVPRAAISARAMRTPSNATAMRNTRLMQKSMPTAKAGRAATRLSAMPNSRARSIAGRPTWCPDSAIRRPSGGFGQHRGERNEGGQRQSRQDHARPGGHLPKQALIDERHALVRRTLGGGNRHRRAPMAAGERSSYS